MTTNTYSSTQTAKFVRKALKASFPKQKFSVTSSRDTIDINWFDGVSTQEVAAVTDRFGGMSFDGMDDSTHYQKTIIDGEEAQCYCYSPDLHRKFTPEFARKVMAKALAMKPYLQLQVINYETNSVIDYTDGYNGITH
jgi:Large polyvalent protein associated domain 29